ncbi:hypothetical protein HMPREF9073_00437 [Capnocytophaga sp. oral taxon 326 str. F0382]|nr:hypothetical protein HMPREF9073_00437 [Capnocytophaga sp. oral taxon 326 str. F0382]
MQNAPTQHTIKVIDYQDNQLCQRCDPHERLRTLAKCSDAKCKQLQQNLQYYSFAK